MSRRRLAFTAAEFREIDRRATEDYGIPVERLMERAGRAVAREVLKILKPRRRPSPAGKKKGPSPVLVLCGGGNNGGDGFAAARHLSRKGVPVRVLLLKPLESLRGAARLHWDEMRAEGVPCAVQPKFDTIGPELRRSAVIVDSLFGTGIKSEIEEPARTMIEKINASRKPVVAVDIPSGLDADVPRAHGIAVRAGRTVTMGAWKKSFLDPRSRFWTGRVVVADIGFPKALLQAASRFRRSRSAPQPS